MKLLALGDIVGTRTVDYLERELWALRSRLGADCVVANGENADDIHGLSSAQANRLLDAGVDLLTTGNHVWGKRDLIPLLEEESRVLRPANYPPTAPGSGWAIVPAGSWRMLAINVMGNVFMDSLADPFDTVEKILDRNAGSYDFAMLDIHAEATAEKLALARVFDGRIAVIFGTHTHVQTADEGILPRGSGYITDLGMCGPADGILGTDAAAVIRKFRTHMPQRFLPADGPLALHGALFTLDSSFRVTAVDRISLPCANAGQTAKK
ncbi:MAG: YmdB family metallophosphoesterase [Clostridia bacterium]|nr:YmdB family metallophosphoesterase [Clostridia bacterium]